jgi:hypothetical protein
MFSEVLFGILDMFASTQMGVYSKFKNIENIRKPRPPGLPELIRTEHHELMVANRYKNRTRGRYSHLPHNARAQKWD